MLGRDVGVVGYALVRGEMGEVLRAVRWLASVGWGWCEGWSGGGGELGTLWRVEGRGGIMMVPKGEKAAGVSECIGTRTGLDGETVGRVEGIVVVVWDVMCSSGRTTRGATVLVADVVRSRSGIVSQTSVWYRKMQ